MGFLKTTLVANAAQPPTSTRAAMYTKTAVVKDANRFAVAQDSVHNAKSACDDIVAVLLSPPLSVTVALMFSRMSQLPRRYSCRGMIITPPPRLL